MPKIVFISDTHGLHGQMQVPEGDILVHAGDMTNVGRINEVAALAYGSVKWKNVLNLS